MFRDVVKAQEETLKKDSKYAQMNVINALREEADLSIPANAIDREQKKFAYMQKHFKNLTAMAVTRGADNIDTTVNRPINSWGIHPECINPLTLNPKEIQELFGQSNIETNPLTAASQEISELFSKYEIVRADSVNLLRLKKNFKGLIETPSNNYAQGNTGVYYKAYRDLIDRIISGDSKAYSPHLDKRWHLPSYMPNIGMSMDNTLNDIFRALYFGLLFERLTVKPDKGEDYWYAIAAVSDYIMNLERRRIGVKGKGVAMAINMLFEQGLANNPKLVDSILSHSEKEWNKAREAWLNTKDKTFEEMKEQPIVKKILSFTFSKIYGTTSWSDAIYDFFYIISDQNVQLIAQNIGKLKSLLFKDLTERFIDVFEASKNTQELCEYVFGAIKEDTLRREALAALEQAEANGLFEPKGA